MAAPAPPAEALGPHFATGLNGASLQHFSLKTLRNRLIANPRFQAWAAQNWFTRAIARRQASRLFDLGAGFVYSQILSACLRLDLFTQLADGPRAAAELAPTLALTEAATERLLRAATALGLTEQQGARYGLGMLGAAILGNPGVAAMLAHHALLYADLADPIALLRGQPAATLQPAGATPALAGYWPYAGAADPTALPPEAVAPYSRLMAASNALVADQVLAAYPIARHRCLLDVGGGEGAFLTACAARAPQLALQLFDLPAVASRAQTRLTEAGLAPRTRITGGNFFADPLPIGADLITLIRVLHDHDDENVMKLLTAAHQALPAGGVVLIGEPMAGLAGTARAADAYFGFYLLAMGTGRARTPQTLFEMLRAAGFSAPRLHRTSAPLLAGLITARR